MDEHINQFYPTLTEPAEGEAKNLIEDFKKQLITAAEESISKLYCDIVPFIESDSWGNFRNQIMDGFKNYHNNKIHLVYDFKEIRQKIFEENRDEIIQDLNQDMIEEIKQLKETISILHQHRNQLFS